MIPRKNLSNVFVILETLLEIVMLIFLIMSIFLSLSTIVVGSFLIGIMFGLLLATREKLRLNSDRGRSRFSKRPNKNGLHMRRMKEIEKLTHNNEYRYCDSVEMIMLSRRILVSKQKSKEYRNKNPKYKKR